MSARDNNQNGRTQDEILAAEYALGLLPPAIRRNLERRIAADRPFAEIVARWQRELAAFDPSAEDEADAAAIVAANAKAGAKANPKATPKAHAKDNPKTAGNTNSRGSAKAGGSGMRMVPRPQLLAGLSSGAASGVLSGLPGRAGAPLARRRRMLIGAIAGIAIVALLVMLNASGLPGRRPPAADLLADLSSPDAKIDLSASYDAASGEMQIAPAAASRAEKKSLQLWLMPASGKPASLGILPEQARGRIAIPSELRSGVADGATLAVTLEPFGGSPTGQPTGPMVASGAVHGL